MALSFGSSGSRGPSPDAMRSRAPLAPGEAPDDYVIETEVQSVQTPVGIQAVRVLQAVLIGAIALLSLAVFWVIATIAGIV